MKLGKKITYFPSCFKKRFTGFRNKLSRFHPFYLLSITLVFAACQRVSTQIEPSIERPCHEKELQRERRTIVQKFNPSIFPPLTAEEKASDWGKEYEIGFLFAEDFDLYRAITSFKRALILLGRDNPQRALEIQYYITLSYYLGHKYVEVVYMVETGTFATIDATFAPFNDLLVMLYDSYRQLGECDKAEQVLGQLESTAPTAADKLVFFSEIERADFDALPNRNIDNLLSCYCAQRKSVRKAQALNAILPGAGYWYVGQRQTAITAVLVNALFIGASVHFYLHENYAAGAIFTSLECGWYFGGITGAGLAARCYNERLYEGYAQKICHREKLYPLFQLNYTF